MSRDLTNTGPSLGSAETLQYKPPAGSALAGGSVDIALYGDGYGYDASGTAIAYTPEMPTTARTSSTVQPWAAGMLTGSTPYDYTGVLALPSGRGGDFYLSAACGGVEGQTCDEGGSEGAWSLVRLWWANFLLSNSSASRGKHQRAPAHPRRPRHPGTHIHRKDPGGPGVYTVTTQIDGKTLYSARLTPTGGSACQWAPAAAR